MPINMTDTVHQSLPTKNSTKRAITPIIVSNTSNSPLAVQKFEGLPLEPPTKDVLKGKPIHLKLIPYSNRPSPYKPIGIQIKPADGAEMAIFIFHYPYGALQWTDFYGATRGLGVSANEDWYHFEKISLNTHHREDREITTTSTAAMETNDEKYK